MKPDRSDAAPASHPAENAASYSKAQLLRSRRFTPLQRDVLSALLSDGERYTVAEAESALRDFYRGTVS
jgi:hypothetical protein